MKYIALITALLLSASAHAKDVNTYGIITVPEIWSDKLADCEYLGVVDSRGKWISSGYNNPWGRKSSKKKFYKEAQKIGATHILIPSTGTEETSGVGDWYSMYELKAQAFNCGIVAINEASKSTSYIDELKALAALRDDGIINEDEFQKQKAEILERE